MIYPIAIPASVLPRETPNIPIDQLKGKTAGMIQELNDAMATHKYKVHDSCKPIFKQRYVQDGRIGYLNLDERDLRQGIIYSL